MRRNVTIYLTTNNFLQWRLSFAAIHLFIQQSISSAMALWFFNQVVIHVNIRLYSCVVARDHNQTVLCPSSEKFRDQYHTIQGVKFNITTDQIALLKSLGCSRQPPHLNSSFQSVCLVLSQASLSSTLLHSRDICDGDLIAYRVKLFTIPGIVPIKSTESMHNRH